MYPLVATDVNLGGCGGPNLTVLELIPGSGADSCPNHLGGACVESMPLVGEYPIQHNLYQLSLGEKYYVQTRYRNSQGFGLRRLSSPLYQIPRHNPPGAPPPVQLEESTSTSITVSWKKPKNNGGKSVSGYELWVDDWSGGNKYMVYDGSD